jgi:N-acetylglutamate synthase-like GNAT family acetyltransferase
MIRAATSSKRDIDEIYDMLREYRLASPLVAHQYLTEDTAIAAVQTIIIEDKGIVLLSEDQGNITGMLMAVHTGNMWDRNIRCMNELAFWVKPQYRGGLSGYRLLKKYKELGDRLMAAKKIEYYTISKMINSPDLNYGRYGFSKMEESWICQRSKE